MFGDYFGQRADYSKGLFYSMHHQYLNDGQKSSVEAPNDFKSRRALRNIRLANEQNKDDHRRKSFHIHFNESKTKGKFRNAANLVMNAVNFENAARDLLNAKRKGDMFEDEDDWIFKKEAGVKFWVNKYTGDVKTTCPIPKKDLTPPRRASNFGTIRVNSRQGTRQSMLSTSTTRATSRESSRGRSRGRMDNKSSNRNASLFYGNLGEGTGSLVYDEKEMQDFWQLLDSGVGQ